MKKAMILCVLFLSGCSSAEMGGLMVKLAKDCKGEVTTTLYASTFFSSISTSCTQESK